MKIKVEPLLPTGSYLNVRIGIEYDIPDMVTDDIIKGQINSSWDLLVSIHRERYPHLYNEDGTAKYEMYKGEEMKGTHVRNVVEEPIDKIESWKTVISMCTSITALERFKPQVDRENNQELTEAYNNKLKQLQSLQK